MEKKVSQKKINKVKKNKECAKKKINIYYQNVRGLKSKLDTLQEMTDDYQPSLVRIVETHMQKEEEIQISGYSLLYRNDRSAKS